MVAEVEQLETIGVDEGRGRRRDEHLAPMAGRRDATRSVYIHADVALFREQWGARVDPNPYADRAAFQGLPTLGRGVERLARRRQREEESVSLGTYFDSIVAGERRSQCLPVSVELERVAFCAELVEELGRAGDVREDERHRSG
ncbi:MAG TPA: hypothetical protein VHN56_04065, partial [Actinomycetota bacterium]|nr:hypothetical protein [Actinomycetota bacterium]